MSTMEPEDMSGGRRMDGNSICIRISLKCARRRVSAYYSLILGQEDGHAGVDFADSQ